MDAINCITAAPHGNDHGTHEEGKSLYNLDILQNLDMKFRQNLDKVKFRQFRQFRDTKI